LHEDLVDDIVVLVGFHPNNTLPGNQSVAVDSSAFHYLHQENHDIYQTVTVHQRFPVGVLLWFMVEEISWISLGTGILDLF